jgi:hypothetical protein
MGLEMAERHAYLRLLAERIAADNEARREALGVPR